MRVLTLVLGIILAPAAAYSVGSSDPPEPETPTTQQCEDGELWDEKSESCVPSEESFLQDGQRLHAVQILAHNGQYERAWQILGTVTDQSRDEVLAYKGFLSRKAGDFETAMTYYDAALTQNPDNLLARSYMGMAMAERGELELAQVQLQEIRARGGSGGWPEQALLAVISGNRLVY